MCTNRALVDSMECYMDDLVDSFEDFVKKSVIVISVAVGLIVVMIAYVLKTITDRAQPVGAGDITRGSSRNRNVIDSNVMLVGRQEKRRTFSDASASAKMQNRDDKDLQDGAFSGTLKLECKASPCSRSRSGTRLSLPSLRTNSPKSSAHKLGQPTPKVDEVLGSCCSMCCDDKCEGSPNI